MESRDSGQPLVAWAVVIGAVSAAAGLFNAMDEAISNRKIVASLEVIKEYMQLLDAKIDRVEANTDKILKKLDRLPNTVRIIVQEEISLAFLQERYSRLKNIKNNILILGHGRKYRVNKLGWDELSETLTYLFDYENRLSHMFRLVEGCELALSVTRNRTKPFVVNLVQEKISLIEELRNDLTSEINGDIEKTLRLLGNSKYVKSHNLTPDLASIDTLEFKKTPNRNRTIHYQDQVCRMVRTGAGRCREDNEIRRCHMEPRSRQEPDRPFHTARDAHVKKITDSVSALKEDLGQLGNLSALIDVLINYLGRVEQLSVLNESTALYFQVTPEQSTSSAQEWVDLSDDDYYSYYDDVDKDPNAAAYRNISPLEQTAFFDVLLPIECP